MFYLVTESDTSHTILHTENVIVDRIDTNHVTDTSATSEGKLRVIDAREVKGTGGLRLVHSDAEWPRECRHGAECILG